MEQTCADPISGLGDGELAAYLARTAGDLLRDLQRASTDGGLDPTALRDLGDARSQSYLDNELRRHRPADAILSEEAADDEVRLSADRVWIIDPLDGTREYSEGRDDWAVHVALWAAGDLVAGAVALPGIGIVMDSRAADPMVPPTRDRRLRLAVSRTRATPLVRQVAQALDAELVPMGSAGYKVCAVVRGDVDFYLHSGGQYEWDSAAPVAVASGYGLHASRIDGSALAYNQRDSYLPDLLVCGKDIAGPVLHEISLAM